MDQARVLCVAIYRLHKDGVATRPPIVLVNQACEPHDGQCIVQIAMKVSHGHNSWLGNSMDHQRNDKY